MNILLALVRLSTTFSKPFFRWWDCAAKFFWLRTIAASKLFYSSGVTGNSHSIYRRVARWFFCGFLFASFGQVAHGGEPTNVSVRYDGTSQGEVRILVTWDAPTSVNGALLGYQLERRTQLDETFARLLPAADATEVYVNPQELKFLDANVTVGMSYTYRVLAFTRSPDGVIIRHTPRFPPVFDLYKPTRAAIIQPRNDIYNRVADVTVALTAGEGVDLIGGVKNTRPGFAVQYEWQHVSGPVLTLTPNANQHNVRAIVPTDLNVAALPSGNARRAIYQLAVTRSDGISVSPRISIRVIPANLNTKTIEPPRGVGAKSEFTPEHGHRVSVSWAPARNAQHLIGYQVMRSSISNPTPVKIAPASDSADTYLLEGRGVFYDTDVQIGETYTYTVTAFADAETFASDPSRPFLVREPLRVEVAVPTVGAMLDAGDSLPFEVTVSGVTEELSVTYVWSTVGGNRDLPLSNTLVLNPTLQIPELPLVTRAQQVIYQLYAFRNDGGAYSRLVPVNIHPQLSPVRRATAFINFAPSSTPAAPVPSITLAWTRPEFPVDPSALISYQVRRVGSDEVVINIPPTVDLTFTAHDTGAGLMMGDVRTYRITARSGARSRDWLLDAFILNNAPTADAGDRQTVTEDSRVTLTAEDSVDLDGHTLTYRWRQIAPLTGFGNNLQIEDAQTATPEFVAPNVLVNATLVFGLTVSDALKDSPEELVTVLVTGSNEPPVVLFDYADNRVTIDADSIVTLSRANVTELEGAAVTYTWQIKTNAVPPLRLDVGNQVAAVLTVPELSRSILGDVEYVLTLLATDTDNLVGMNDVTVVVTRPRAVSDVTAHEFTVERGGEHLHRVSVTWNHPAIEPTVLPINYQVRRGFRGTRDTVYSYHDIYLTQAPPVFVDPFVVENGDYQYQIYTRTEFGDSLSGVAYISTTRRPTLVVNALANVHEDERAVLDAAASTDPDGDTLTYVWEQISPSGAHPAAKIPLQVGDGRVSFIAPNLTEDTRVQFRLTVSDGVYHLKRIIPIDIITGQQLPVISIAAPQTVGEGEVVTLDASDTRDPQGRNVQYIWEVIPTSLRDTVSARDFYFRWTDGSPSAMFIAPRDLINDLHLEFRLTVVTGETLRQMRLVPITVRAANPTEPRDLTSFISFSNRKPRVTLTWKEPAIRGGGFTGYRVHRSLDEDDTFHAFQLLSGDDVLPPDTTTFIDTTADLGETYTYRITAYSAAGERVASISVNIFNMRPVPNAGVSQTVAEGATVTLDGSESHDVNGQELTYDWRQRTGSVSVAFLTGVNISRPQFIAPNLPRNENFVFRLTVGDGLSTTAHNVTVTITADDDPIIVDAGDDVIAEEGRRVVLDGSRTMDPEGFAVTYRWSYAGSSNLQLQAVTEATLSFNYPTNTSETREVFNLHATVTTPGGASDTQTDSVTVFLSGIPSVPRNVNVQSLITNGIPRLVFTWEEPAYVGVGFAGYVLTRGSDEVATTSELPTGSTRFADNDPVLAAGIATNQMFTYQLAAQNFTGVGTPAVIRVDELNSAPRAEAGETLTVHLGAPVTLDGSASRDPNEQMLTYVWEQIGGAATGTLDDVNIARPSFSAPTMSRDELLTYELTVTEAVTGLTDRDSVNVILRLLPSEPRNVTAVLQPANGNQGVLLNWRPPRITSVGFQGYVVTRRSLLGEPDTVILNDGQAISERTFVDTTVAFESIYEYSVQARNEQGDSVASETRIVVINENAAPDANAGVDESVGISQSITLNGGASSDPERGALTYRWTFRSADGVPIQLQNANTARPSFTTPSGNRLRKFYFTLTVTDRHGATDTDKMIVLSGPPLRAPRNLQASYLFHFAHSQARITLTWDAPLPQHRVGLETYIVYRYENGVPRFVGNTVLSNPHKLTTFIHSDNTNRLNSHRVLRDTEYVYAVVSSASPLYLPPASAAQAALVTFTFTNIPPIVDAGEDITVTPGTSLQLGGENNAVDPDSDGAAIRVNWHLRSGPNYIAHRGDTPQRPIVTIPSDISTVQQLVYEAIVQDGFVEVLDLITITITPARTPPVAVIGDDRTVTIGEPITLDGSASFDPDNTPLQYRWSFRVPNDPAPYPVDLDDPGLARQVFDMPYILVQTGRTDYHIPDTLDVYLTVEDGTGLKSEDHLQLTIGANRPPGPVRGLQVVDEAVRDQQQRPYIAARLQWSAPFQTYGQFATNYQIFRRTNLRDDFQLIGSRAEFAEHFIDRDVSPGNTYYYKVTASNTTGTSEAFVTHHTTRLPDIGIAPIDMTINGRYFLHYVESGARVTLNANATKHPGIDTDIFYGRIFYHWTIEYEADDSTTQHISLAYAHSPLSEFTAPEVTETLTMTLGLTADIRRKDGSEVAANSTVRYIKVVPDFKPSATTLTETHSTTAFGQHSITLDWTAPTETGFLYSPSVVLIRETLGQGGRTERLTLDISERDALTLIDADDINLFPTPAVGGKSYTYQARSANLFGETLSNLVRVDLPRLRVTADAGEDRVVGVLEVTVTGSATHILPTVPLTYTWRHIRGEPVVVTVANARVPTATFTPPRLQARTPTTFEFCASEARGETHCDEVVLTIERAGGPSPVKSVGAFQTYDADDMRHVTLFWDMPDWKGPNFLGYNVYFQDTVNTTLVTPTPITELQYVHANAPEGNFALLVRAVNVIGESDIRAAIVSVFTPPRARLGDDQTVAEGARVTLDGSASGSDYGDGIDLTYTWRMLSPTDNPRVSIDLPPLTAEANPQDVRFIFNAPDQLLEDVTLQFQLRVTLHYINSIDEANTVVVVRAGENDPPTTSAGDNQSVAEGSVVMLDATATTDPEGEAVTYLWMQESGTRVTLDDPTSATPTFTAPDDLLGDDTLAFQVRATDARGASALGVVVIHVIVNNELPTATVGAAQTVQEGATVTLIGSGSDPENARLEYVWQQVMPVSGSAAESATDLVITLSDTSITNPTFVAPSELVSDLVLQFQLRVMDSQRAYSQAAITTVTILAGDNAPPGVVRAPDQTVAEGTRVTLRGGGVDPENEPLNYVWQQLQPLSGLGHISNFVNGLSTFEFTAPQQLMEDVTMVFALSVSDARTAAARVAQTTVVVEAGVNDAPIVTVDPDETVLEQSTVNLLASAVDLEGDAINFMWVQTKPDAGKGANVTLNNPNTPSPNFVAPAQLVTDVSLVFSVTAIDARGAVSAPGFVTITVTAGVNDAPVAVSESQRVDEGVTVTLDATASTDAEDENLFYEWSQSAGASIELSSTTAAQPTFLAPDNLVNDLEFEFVLRVRDARNVVSQPVTVTVTVTAGANDSPMVDAGDAQTVAERQRVTLSGGGADAEDEVLTYRWQQIQPTEGKGANVSLSSSDAARVTFIAPEQLIADIDLVFALTVTDARDASSPAANVTIRVEAGQNDPPVVIVDNTQTIAEGAAAVIIGGGSDPEGQPLRYLWEQVDEPKVALTGADTATLRFTAPDNFVRDDDLSFRLTVTEILPDGDPRTPLSAADTVIIEITADNSQPVAAAGVNQTVAEGATVQLAGGGMDSESQPLSYRWEQLLPMSGLGTDVELSDAALHNPTFVAPVQLINNLELVFRLAVSDAELRDTDDVTVTVTAGVNDPPIAHAGDNLTVNEGNEVTLNGEMSSDLEGQPLSYSWAQVDGTPTLSLENHLTVTPSFVVPELLTDTTLTFRLSVNDGVNAAQQTAASDVAVHIIADNDPPTANAGDPQRVNENDTVMLSADASADPENQSLSYRWVQTSGQAVVLSDATLSNPTFSAPPQLMFAVNLIFQLTVTDGEGQDIDAVTVTVAAGTNDAPMANAGANQSVSEGEMVQLNGEASTDPEGAPLRYHWVQSGIQNGDATVSLSSATTPRPTFTAPEFLTDTTLTFSLTVNDNTHDSPVTAASSVEVVVSADNDAPTANIDARQTVAEGVTVTLSGDGTDPEAQNLTYTWTQVSGVSVVLTESTPHRPTFIAPMQLFENINLRFQLVVSDGVNNSPPVETTITVTKGANDAPIADAGDAQTVIEGAQVTLHGEGSSDPENEVIRHTWTRVSPTEGKGAVQLSNLNAAQPEFAAPRQLSADLLIVFELTVADVRGLESASPARVTVTVTAGENEAPTARPSAPQQVPEDTLIALSGDGSDPENEGLEYRWSQALPASGVGAGLNISDNNIAMPTVRAPNNLAAPVTLVFQLIVLDERQLSSQPERVTVVVTNIDNLSPTATADVTRLTVNEGETFMLSGVASDPEGEALTILWRQLSGLQIEEQNVDTLTATFQTSPLISNAEAVFQFTATDPGGLSGSDIVVVSILADNDPPTAEAGADRSVMEGSRITLAGVGTDSDTTLLRFQWTQLAPTEGRGAKIKLFNTDISNPLLTTPRDLVESITLQFQLSVNDGESFDTDTVNIIVMPGDNDLPIANAGDAQTVAEGVTVTLDGAQSSDVENQPLTFAWTQAAGTPTVTLSDATNVMPTFVVPQLVTDATLTFSLVVNDGRENGNGDSIASTVNITITADNDLPTAMVESDFTVDENESVTLTGGGTDPEGLALTYQWEQLGSTTVTLDETTPHRPTFTAPDQLVDDVSLVFALTTNDGEQDSVRREVTVTVTAGVNDAPTAVVGNAQTVDEGDEVRLDGSMSADPEGTSLTYTWQQIAGMAVALSSSTDAQPAFTAPRDLVSNEVLMFSLMVRDATDLSSAQPASATITVTAGSNNIPIAHPGDEQTASEGETVTLSGARSSDPESERLTYAWEQTAPTSGLGANLTLTNPNTVMPTFVTPVQLVSDITLTFRLTVTDARNAVSVPLSINVITAVGENDGPSVTVSADQTVTEGVRVTLIGGGSDPEGQGLTYRWRQLDEPRVPLINANTAQANFIAPNNLLASTDLVFELTVTDSGFATPLSRTATTTINIIGVNEPPTATAGDDQRVAEGAQVTLAGGGSDSEGQNIRYRWQQIEPTDGIGANVALSDDAVHNPSFTAPTQLVNNIALVFQLIVNDSAQDSQPQTVTITVDVGDNDLPIARVGDDQTVAEGARVNLNGSTSSDPENQNLTFRWTQTGGQADGHLVTLSDASVAQPAFDAPLQLVDDATLIFSLTVTDSIGAASAQPAVVTITVTAGPNDAPTANAGISRNVREGASVILSAADSSDPEGENLLYTWSQTLPTSGIGAGIASFNRNSAMPTFTAPIDLTGDTALVFALTVTDARGLSSAVSNVTITVLHLANVDNNVPVANAGEDQTVAEGALVNLASDASGVSPPNLIYRWTQLDTPRVMLLNANTAMPSFTAPDDLVSDTDLVFQLSVTDTNFSPPLTGTSTVSILVRALNDPPVSDPGNNQRVNENQLVQLIGDGSDSENVPLRYIWLQLAPESGRGAKMLSDVEIHNPAPTFTAPSQLADDLEIIFAMMVTDGVKESMREAVTVTVTAGANDAPTANAGNAQNVLEAARVTLRGGGSDPEDEALSYAWQQIGSPRVTLSATNISQPTFTAPSNLANRVELIFALTVTDERNLASAASRVTVTVNAATTSGNTAPTADAGSTQTVREGARVTLDGNASLDRNGDALTYRWTQADTPQVQLLTPTASRTIFTAPENLSRDEILVFNLTVTEDNAEQLTATATTTVTVLAENSPPDADAGDDRQVAEGEQVILDASNSGDSEQSPLLYEWRQTGGAVLMSISSATRPLASFRAPTQLAEMMQLTFTVEVTDIGGESSTADVVISVMPGENDAPIANAGVNQTVFADTLVTLSAAGSSDPEDEALTYQWTQSRGDAVDLRTADSAQASFRSPTVPGRSITLEFNLGVTDARGRTSATGDRVAVLVLRPDVMLVSADDVLKQIVLPEVMRATTGSTVTAIRDRIEESISNAGFRIGGKSTFASMLQTHGEAMSDDEHDRDWKTLLNDSDFVLPLNEVDADFGMSQVVSWGVGEYRELSGNNDLDWEGNLASAHLGIDRRLSPQALLGFAASSTRGQFENKGKLADANTEIRGGEYEMSLTGVYPYFGWREQSADLWVAGGYGTGETKVNNGMDDAQISDISMGSFAIGGSGRIWPWLRTEVRVKGEGFASAVSIKDDSDAKRDESVSVNRLRVMLEARRTRALSTQTVSMNLLEHHVEVGLRSDAGDGLIGSAAEVGAGLRYVNKTSRVTAEGRMRALVGHEEDIDEWGISGRVAVEAGVDGQGFSFALEPNYGETDGDVEKLWATELHDLPNVIANQNDYALRLKTKLGYGMRFSGVRGLVTPYSEITLGDGDVYRVGVNWKAAERINFNLHGEQSDDNAIRLEGEIGF